MQETGFEEVDACVLRRHNTAAQYIATRQIMDLCEEMVHIMRMWVVKMWREKEVIDLVVAREVTAASEEKVGAEETEGEADGVAGK